MCCSNHWMWWVDETKTGGYACFDNIKNYLGAYLFRQCSWTSVLYLLSLNKQF